MAYTELTFKEGREFMDKLNAMNEKSMGLPVIERTRLWYENTLRAILRETGHGLENLKFIVEFTEDDKIRSVGCDEFSNFALLGINYTLKQYNEQR